MVLPFGDGVFVVVCDRLTGEQLMVKMERKDKS